MKLERSFRRNNGKEVLLRELTDLVALRSSNRDAKPSAAATAEGRRPSSSRRRAVSAKTRLKSQTLDAIAPEVSLPEVRAFEDAGWVFVRDTDSESVSPEAPRAKVFIKSGGRLALGTNKLIIKFKDDLSEEQAEEILKPYGGRVLDKLGFAPGLFRVEVTDEARGDVLDVANELAASGVCEFAEPELIEAVGGR